MLWDISSPTKFYCEKYDEEEDKEGSLLNYQHIRFMAALYE
jgi:hypothetical protein